VTTDASQLLGSCAFPPAQTPVALAVSGGPDSLGLLLLALASDLRVGVHHVDHHARSASGDDAAYVREVCTSLGVNCVVHDVVVEAGPNFEARARAERRRVLPEGVLTGHTMDDLAETVLLNMMRGAGVDGLSPMVNDPTKPLRSVRRSDLHAFVHASGLSARHDESNDDLAYRRNRVRLQLLPLMCEVAERDVVPILARQAAVLFEERAWLEALSENDLALDLADADCRELSRWPRARLRRWLRVKLFVLDEVQERHPPSAAEVERAMSVVLGEAVATELSGGRRLSRHDQRLSLEDDSTTLTNHG
jgi:tRNA(Ile)-lysidine synthase